MLIKTIVEKEEEKFETAIDLNIDAFIPMTYISNEFQKLDMYKRIAGIDTREGAEDMLDELIDRFGEPPKSVQNLLAIARIKGQAHKVYVKEVVQKGDEIQLVMYERAQIDPAQIPSLIMEFTPSLRFVPETPNPCFWYRLRANSKEKGKELLDVLEHFLERMELLLCGQNQREKSQIKAEMHEK